MKGKWAKTCDMLKTASETGLTQWGLAIINYRIYFLMLNLDN